MQNSGGSTPLFQVQPPEFCAKNRYNVRRLRMTHYVLRNWPPAPGWPAHFRHYWRASAHDTCFVNKITRASLAETLSNSTLAEGSTTSCVKRKTQFLRKIPGVRLSVAPRILHEISENQRFSGGYVSIHSFLRHKGDFSAKLPLSTCHCES